ncbi:hypothetical protein [Clavibacter michiganensis]|uniref:hypothetical protein n=1 Tax=Clavibacter michiganensis TaxID=28447 RepID=UPI0005BA6E4A|nr:hypothetical protein [Clavibacter michiganensis]
MRRREDDPGRDPAFTRTMTRIAVAAVAVGAAALAMVVFVATHPPEPTVVGQRFDAAGAGLVTFDGPAHTDPEVRWLEVGQRFLVTTYGSSSCPEAPTSVRVEGGGLRVVMQVTGGPACTEDLGPTTYAVAVPEGRTAVERLDVVLDREDEPALDLVLEPHDGDIAPARIATYVSDGFSDAALVAGVLVVRDGCVYLERETSGDEAADLVLPVFPEQTTSWDGATLTTGDEVHALGEHVSFGGGTVSEPTSPRGLRDRPGIPDACDATTAWGVAPPG